MPRCIVLVIIAAYQSGPKRSGWKQQVFVILQLLWGQEEPIQCSWLVSLSQGQGVPGLEKK